MKRKSLTSTVHRIVCCSRNSFSARALQGLLKYCTISRTRACGDETPDCMREVMTIGKNQGTLTEDGHEAICEAWVRDADYYSEFDWNYEF